MPEVVTDTKTVKLHNAKRRPAMIPADAELSSEDKKAIKLRTGRWPVFVHPAASTAGEAKHGIRVTEEEIRKRKPSTTAEQFYENLKNANEIQSRTTTNTKAG